MSHRAPVKSSLVKVDAVGVGVCLALTCALYVAAIGPRAGEPAADAAAEAQIQQQQRSARSLLRTNTSLQRKLDHLRQRIDENRVVLEPLSHLNRRLAKLNVLAGECGIAVDEVGVGETAEGSHYLTVPLRLRGRGAFRSSVTLLRAVHAEFPDTAVHAFEISNNPHGSATAPKLQIDFALYAAGSRES